MQLNMKTVIYHLYQQILMAEDFPQIPQTGQLETFDVTQKYPRKAPEATYMASD